VPYTELEIAVQAETTFVLDVKYCLRRGARLIIGGKTVNVGLTVAFYGDEYIAE